MSRTRRIDWLIAGLSRKMWSCVDEETGNGMICCSKSHFRNIYKLWRPEEWLNVSDLNRLYKEWACTLEVLHISINKTHRTGTASIPNILYFRHQPIQQLYTNYESKPQTSQWPLYEPAASAAMSSPTTKQIRETVHSVLTHTVLAAFKDWQKVRRRGFLMSLKHRISWIW